MATWWNFIGNNSYSVGADEAEKMVRSKEPLLLHPDETIKLAFKSALDPRDKSYLTSHRILLKDGKGLGGKRKNFKSVPYSSVQAFSVQTAGAVLDGDTELNVWSTGHNHVRINFGKGEVDLFAVKQFMNTKVLQNFQPTGTQDAIVRADSVPVEEEAAAADVPTDLGSIIDWLGDNARAFSAPDVEKRFKAEYPVLMPDEKVELAFKCGRDFTVLTDKRFMLVDVKGLVGKQVEFRSVLWPCVRGIAVETAGRFLDRDTEMTLFTNILGIPWIQQDFRKGKADLWSIQTCLSNKLLGKDTQPMPDIDKLEGHVDPTTSWWSRDNNRPLDAVEMNRLFHASPPILQSTEVVDMAFKGRRDLVLFTTKRVIKVDRKGLTGKKTEYVSIPWHAVVAFGVRTAGKHLDTDSEALLWTEMMYFDDGENTTPYMSYWSLDFNKNLVDIMAIKTYLSQRCMNAIKDAVKDTVPMKPNSDNTSTKEQGMDKFLSKIGNDNRAVDPTEIDRVLHTELPILLEKETVVMAFKSGRDMNLFTNLRLLVMDVQGWSGKKVEYTSLPYTSIRGFAAESAGGFMDRDSEVDLYTRNLWSLSKKHIDFRKGKADIILIQKFLSAMILGTEEDAARYTDNPSFSFSKQTAMNANSFASWITDNSVEENAEATTLKLQKEPPILLSNEKCEKVYRSGRDWYVYTNLRLLLIDVQGLSGKKVQYLSLDLRWVTGFEVETAGHLDRDAEVYIYSDLAGKHKVEQDILVKRGDVMEMHKYLTEKLMF